MSGAPRIEIAGRRIGPGAPVYVVAELSGNHGHRLDRALALVDAAADAGADAVKLQTYTADTLTLDCDRPEFRVQGGTPWDGSTLHQLYQQACTPWEWHPELMARARERGLHCFSSPFDPTAVAFLEELEVPAYKIASFELVDLPLIRKAAATGKPLILSTGMATLEEIREAVDAAREAGARALALLACSSAYPSPPDAIHLRRIPHLAETFGVVSGLSDHTLGIAVPVAAVALGACIIEKHLCLDRGEPGPDSAFSLEPDEFRQMVEQVRVAEQALGTPRYGGGPAEAASRAFRRSLFVVADVRAGERFTPENVRSIRPAHGLHPRHLEEVLGRRARCDIERGTPLRWELVE
jgi:N-acetylneuraminate synthase